MLWEAKLLAVGETPTGAQLGLGRSAGSVQGICFFSKEDFIHLFLGPPPLHPAPCLYKIVQKGLAAWGPYMLKPKNSEIQFCYGKPDKLRKYTSFLEEQYLSEVF